MNALISVILPVHNGERFLRQAIVSVQEQSYTNWELIIINDGSTDSSGKLLKSLVRLMTESKTCILKNRGLQKA